MIMKPQMSLEDFKKKAIEFLTDRYPNYKDYKTRIEEESEGYWEDSWTPESMVAAMVNGLV
jgi:hypothetical protein